MSSAVFERFLIQETGLPRNQVIALYNAGYPWPLWTAHDVRRAGILAQANSLLFPEALAQAEAETERDTFFAGNGSDDRRHGPIPPAEQRQAILSLPWFREMHDHVEQVAARTAFAPRTVWLFSKAIQRFAIVNPGFELIGAFPHRRRWLPS